MALKRVRLPVPEILDAIRTVDLEKLTEDFHPIECLYLDPNDVMEKYLKSEKVYITDYI